MKIDATALLREIKSLQELYDVLISSICHSLGKLTGYLICPMAFKYRSSGLSSDDSEWLDWRVAVYENSHWWIEHLDAIANKLRGFDQAIAGDILEAAGTRCKSAGGKRYLSHFDFAKDVFYKASGCFRAGLLPEPSYRQWLEKGKDAAWVRDCFAKHCPPEHMFAMTGTRADLFNAVSEFSKEVFGEVDPIESCRCTPVSSGCRLEVLTRNLSNGVRIEFAQAKKMAIELQTSAPTQALSASDISASGFEGLERSSDSIETEPGRADGLESGQLNDKQHRNDWLLQLWESKPETERYTYAELEDLLTKNLITRPEWNGIEASTMRDALGEAFQRKYGKPFKSDRRGKKRKKETRIP